MFAHVIVNIFTESAPRDYCLPLQAVAAANQELSDRQVDAEPEPEQEEEGEGEEDEAARWVDEEEEEVEYAIEILSQKISTTFLSCQFKVELNF